MADRYWVGISGVWTTGGGGTTVWSDAAPLSLPTSSCSGTTLTTTGSPALVAGMTVWSSTFVSLGTITGGSGNTWTVSVGGTYASQTMIAATNGASVPTSADNVFFTRPSANYTVTINVTSPCNDFSKTGSTITFAGSGNLIVSGSFSLSGTTTWTNATQITFAATTTGKSITTSGTSFSCQFTFNGVGGGWTLASALTTSVGILLTNGSLNTAGFSVQATSFSSSNSNTRSLTLGASTLTLSSTTIPWNVSIATGMTFSAGTSTITCSGALSGATFDGGGLTYNNVNFTSATQISSTITGANTFNTLAITGLTTTGVNTITLSDNQTISTLTLSAGTSAITRTFLTSNVIGTTRTLTVSTFTAGSANIDFRNITVTGSAAPISGTRFGDCKGNSGITFPAGVNKYWNLATTSSWSATAWALSAGGGVSANNFPLAQDTAIFTSTSPNSGVVITINANWNIGTIDMSARTTNLMSLQTTAAPFIYGNWINGTGNSFSGANALTYAGQGTQTITSAGKTFTQSFQINNPGGEVILQDAFITNSSSANAILITAGTFNANNFAVTLSGSSSSVNASSSTNTRAINIGSGTWTIAGSGTSWNAATATNLTVTGTGTISLTSSSLKNFSGGDIQTYPILNQGGTGQITILGSNKFANITNTAIGTVLFTAGTTNEFTAFNLNGTSTAARLTLGSTALSQATLKKPSTWFMGASSSNGGNNTGLTFTAGGGIDFLAVSYINGQISTPPVAYSGNFFAFF